MMSEFDDIDSTFLIVTGAIRILVLSLRQMPVDGSYMRLESRKMLP